MSDFLQRICDLEKEISSLKSQLEQANKALRDISAARFLDMGHGPLCDHIYGIAEKALSSTNTGKGFLKGDPTPWEEVHAIIERSRS